MGQRGRRGGRCGLGLLRLGRSDLTGRGVVDEKGMGRRPDNRIEWKERWMDWQLRSSSDCDLRLLGVLTHHE
jgi:hypothetical protein